MSAPMELLRAAQAGDREACEQAVLENINWVYPLTWLLSTIFLSIYFIKADWLHSFEQEDLQDCSRDTAHRYGVDFI